MDKNMIKCAFCNWTHKKYYRTKGSKMANTLEKLESHVRLEHPDEWDKIYKSRKASQEVDELHDRQ